MTLEQLKHLNQKFQLKAAGISDMLPISNLVEYASILIRRSQRLERIFEQLLAANEEYRMTMVMGKAENEMDAFIDNGRCIVSANNFSDELRERILECKNIFGEGVLFFGDSHAKDIEGYET